MIRAMYRTPEGTLRTDLGPEDFSPALKEPNGVLWVDFEGNPPEEDEPILTRTFGFHPLAVDDALQESHVPKVDDWDRYLYLVLHAVTSGRDDNGKLETLELDVFLGKNYIVTHHEHPIHAVNHIWECCQRDERYLRRGSDHVLYRIADDMVAAYMPVVERIDEEVETLEDRIVDRPTPQNLSELFRLKRSLLHLRRIIAPQREVLNKLARDDYPVIDVEGKVFFRDTYDHLVRLNDINESLRELVGGALDTYLSVINNRTNDIMKTLTVITTLFMPLSFITGFFGMNFFAPTAVGLQPWTAGVPFVITLGVIIGMPVAMVLWLRRKRWM